MLVVKHAVSPSELRRRLHNHPHSQLAGVADIILMCCLRLLRFHWAKVGGLKQPGGASFPC